MFGQPYTATLADSLYSYTGRRPGMWRSLAAHLLWEQGVGGSNPPIPTIDQQLNPIVVLSYSRKLTRMI